MGGIRPLADQDVDQIADLHDRVVGRGSHESRYTLQEHFTHMFTGHPWRSDACPSLVYEDDDGTIIGCLGVMPRPMRFRGKTITAAISHNFIVAQGSRGSLAGIQLARQFLGGQQDLSMAEGNNTSRRIWEQINGVVAYLYSLSWIKPIRPSRYVLSFLQKRGLPSLLIRCLRPVSSISDRLIPLLLDRQFRVNPPEAEGEELDPLTLRDCLGELAARRMLGPETDEKSMRWLLETLERRTDRGSLQKILVRDRNSMIAGWYIYYAGRDSVGDVVQVGAREDTVQLVLEHMFYHAGQLGVTALSGQMEPGIVQGLSRKNCVFHHDGNSWMLVHSRHADILNAIHAGQAYLSRLEGEWWINHVYG